MRQLARAMFVDALEAEIPLCVTRSLLGAHRVDLRLLVVRQDGERILLLETHASLLGLLPAVSYVAVRPELLELMVTVCAHAQPVYGVRRWAARLLRLESQLFGLSVLACIAGHFTMMAAMCSGAAVGVLLPEWSMAMPLAIAMVAFVAQWLFGLGIVAAAGGIAEQFIYKHGFVPLERFELPEPLHVLPDAVGTRLILADSEALFTAAAGNEAAVFLYRRVVTPISWRVSYVFVPEAGLRCLREVLPEVLQAETEQRLGVRRTPSAG